MTAAETSMGVTVAVATLDDLDALEWIEAASAAQPWTRAQLRAALSDPAASVLVARGTTRSEVWAFCVVVRAADEVEVHEVAVAPALRRRGLGRRLLREALDAAARAGAQRAFLEVRESNAAARALYDALGFKAAGRRRAYYRAPDEDALLLTRNLEIPGGAC